MVLLSGFDVIEMLNQVIIPPSDHSMISKVSYPLTLLKAPNALQQVKNLFPEVPEGCDIILKHFDLDSFNDNTEDWTEEHFARLVAVGHFLPDCNPKMLIDAIFKIEWALTREIRPAARPFDQPYYMYSANDDLVLDTVELKARPIGPTRHTTNPLPRGAPGDSTQRYATIHATFPGLVPNRLRTNGPTFPYSQHRPKPWRPRVGDADLGPYVYNLRRMHIVAIVMLAWHERTEKELEERERLGRAWKTEPIDIEAAKVVRPFGRQINQHWLRLVERNQKIEEWARDMIKKHEANKRAEAERERGLERGRQVLAEMVAGGQDTRGVMVGGPMPIMAAQREAAQNGGSFFQGGQNQGGQNMRGPNGVEDPFEEGQMHGAQNMGTQNNGHQNIGPQNTGPQSAGVQNMGPQNLGHQNTRGLLQGGQNMGGQDMEGQNVEGPLQGGQMHGAQNMGSQDMGPQNTGGQNIGGQNVGGQDMGGHNLSGPIQGGHIQGGHIQGGHIQGGHIQGGHIQGGQTQGGQMPGGQFAGAPIAGGQVPVGNNTAWQNLGPQHFNAQNLGPQNFRGQNIGRHNVGGQNLNGQNFATQNANVHNTGGNNTGNEELNLDDDTEEDDDEDMEEYDEDDSDGDSIVTGPNDLLDANPAEAARLHLEAAIHYMNESFETAPDQLDGVVPLLFGPVQNAQVGVQTLLAQAGYGGGVDGEGEVGGIDGEDGEDGEDEDDDEDEDDSDGEGGDDGYDGGDEEGGEDEEVEDTSMITDEDDSSTESEEE